MVDPPDPGEVYREIVSGLTPSQRHSPGRMQVSYGIPKDVYTEARSLLDIEEIRKLDAREKASFNRQSNQFSAVPVAASVDDYFEAISVYEDESDYYYNPTAGATTDFGRENLAEFYQKTSYKESKDKEDIATFTLRRRPLDIPENVTDESPAKISVMPTSTTDPKRPRTVAAGYDSGRKLLTVVFRDGTFYNYLEVSKTEWNAFKSAPSKGQFIYMYLDGKPRGAADVSHLSSESKESLYRLARTGQILRKGVQHGKKRSSSSRFQPYRRIYK